MKIDLGEFDGKVTAKASTLNILSLYAAEAAKYFRQEGSDALATEADRISNAIYSALSEFGYYD